ncbi:secA, partial [Symbiodinium pilosum]
EIKPFVEKVKAVYDSVAALDHDGLRAKTQEFRQRITDHIAENTQRIAEIKSQLETEEDIDAKEALYEEMDKLEEDSIAKTEDLLNEILPEAFAVVKETARRFSENETLEVQATDFDRSLAPKLDAVSVEGDKAIWKNRWKAAGSEIIWNMVHYDVQLIGGVVLHKGNIAEMATGEGKTLVATLPVYLNALPGKGVHLVTVNDYLARRDAEWMGPLFQFHGLSIDCIDRHKPNSEERRQAYLADITYGTNNEFGFDYLRDNMARSPEDLVQRKHNYAIVDEDQMKEMHIIDDDLYFTIDEKQNQIDLTEKGIDLLSEGKEKAEEREEMMRDFSIKSERIHTMNQLLKAYALFEKDVEYVVMENKVKIVDEQTGRIMEGRRYSDGLHQAIEAKENVKIEAATQTYATVTLQNYFRMYNKLSGMTGTAETEAGEFWDIYELEVTVIPTNRPIARDDRQDLVYKTKREKYNAVIEEVTQLVEQGRPVLVGTTSVEISELLSRALKLRKIRHNVLNAKLHQKEAEIVAEAGQPGTVTIATNMAGRGTDIKLTNESKEAGGLSIIGTERHDSRRVDRQLRGRAGRQGDPGSSQFFVSLEDNLMRLFGSERIAKLMDRMGLKEGEVIQHSMVSKSIERAQKKVEENNFGIRKRLLEYDDVMNSQREVIYKRRRHALYGERLQVDIANMFYDTCESIANEHLANKDFGAFQLELARVFTMESPFTEEAFMKAGQQELVNQLYDVVLKAYGEKNLRIAEMAKPVIKNVFENQSDKFENIVVPFTDGNKGIQVVTNLKKAHDSNCRQLIRDFEKNIVLAIIDDSWKEHLRDMDDLRQSVQGAVYEQKDPLLIYKFEAFELFQVMRDKSNREVVSFLFKGQLPNQESGQVQKAQAPRRSNYDNLQTSHPELAASGGGGHSNGKQPQATPKAQPVVKDKSKAYGRNDVVTIQNLTTGEKKEMKYKKAQPMVEDQGWIVVE